MTYPLNSSRNPFSVINLRLQNAPLRPSIFNVIHCSQQLNPKNTFDKARDYKIHIMDPMIITPDVVLPNRSKKKKVGDEKIGSLQADSMKMVALCGFGYWLQGFRCFPWLVLNFHMAHNLHLHPSTLQLVQNSANLPMVAKPLYGILSDAFYIGGARRLPYISIGAFLQVLSWVVLGLIPAAGGALQSLMICVLMSNLGASVTEVAKDALVTEYGQKHKTKGLHSYAFMASAAGGILGNLLGGFLLLKANQPGSKFLFFASLLAVQLAISQTTREDSLGLPPPSIHNLARNSIFQTIRKQYYDLKEAIGEESLSGPLVWLVCSIAMVPLLSGSIFCYQTQCLNLDPSIIGMSRVTGQLMLLSMILLYNRFWKKVSMRKLIGILQILYASSLLLDFVLVKQANLKLGIPNQVFTLCFSGIAEAIAQFKLLPFQVLFASLAPTGCEGSLMSFSASALCLSSIFSGFLGVGLGSLLGITSGNYSSLPLGIVVQFLAALVPLRWIYYVPVSLPSAKKGRKKGGSRMTWKQRRVGRVVYDQVYIYQPKRESEAQR